MPPLHSIPLSVVINSSMFLPSASFATPVVLPLHPPTNFTFLTISFSLIQIANCKFNLVLSVLKNAESVREASNSVLHDFERPADQSETVEQERAALGTAFYNEFSGSIAPGENVSLSTNKFNFLLFNAERRRKKWIGKKL